MNIENAKEMPPAEAADARNTNETGAQPIPGEQRGEQPTTPEASAQLPNERQTAKFLIAKVLSALDVYLEDVDKSKRALEEMGLTHTPAYLARSRASFEANMRVAVILQNLGWLPEKLASATKTKYSFSSTVAGDGTPVTRSDEEMETVKKWDEEFGFQEEQLPQTSEPAAS